ncbi:MAG: winged helix-turn-helix domain-containing protein [Actinobacteria bacterium]|nr:winged helix-turn-helix domain-containing protein [Actinomycetota bacterium]
MPTHPVWAIATVLAAIGCLAIVSNVVKFFQEYLSDKAAILAVQDIRRRLYDRVLHVPMSHFNLRGASDVPVVVATARDAEGDMIRTLDVGADDYVVKPFKPKELVARLRARLRQREDAEPESLTIGAGEDLVTIDVPGHKVVRGGEQVQLTPLEFDLLVALARKPNTVFTREVLLEQVWNYRHAADTRLVNVHVQRLRAKVERDPEHPQVVVTVRGVGYKAGPD